MGDGLVKSRYRAWNDDRIRNRGDSLPSTSREGANAAFGALFFGPEILNSCQAMRIVGLQVYPQTRYFQKKPEISVGNA